MRRLLSLGVIYNLFQEFIGSDLFWSQYLARHLGDVSGMAILDLGCGTSTILNYLPDTVEYLGVEPSEQYVQQAIREYNSRGKWVAKTGSELETDEDLHGCYDLVMANGVFHHLNDDEAFQMARIAHKLLRAGGRFVSIDCSFVEGMKSYGRLLTSMDRGKFVRTPVEYERFMHKYFPSCNMCIDSDMSKLGYVYTVLSGIK